MFYRIEDLMGEEAGADICKGYVDEDDNICIYYDGSVMNEEDAIAKYERGEYVRQS